MTNLRNLTWSDVVGICKKLHMEGNMSIEQAMAKALEWRIAQDPFNVNMGRGQSIDAGLEPEMDEI